MMDLVGQNMSSCISSPSLTLKGWYDHYTKEDTEHRIHKHTDKYIRWFIRKTVYGGRVFATRRKFASQLWNKILKILIEYSNINVLKEGIPAVIKWYKNSVMEPAIQILKKETQIYAPDKEKELKEILTWCDNNVNHPILQNEVVSTFLEMRKKIKVLPKMDD